MVYARNDVAEIVIVVAKDVLLDIGFIIVVLREARRDGTSLCGDASQGPSTRAITTVLIIFEIRRYSHLANLEMWQHIILIFR